MTENAGDEKTISQKEEETVDTDGNPVTTRRKSVMQINPDGSTTITDSFISSTVKNEIKLDSNTKVNVSEVDAELDDKKYIEALRSKDVLAILKDANRMICSIPLSAGENILKKMGSSLQNDFHLFSFGIYSLEEINEIRKTSSFEKPQKPPNYTKENNIAFKKIQERLDFLKAEEERKKREEEERKRKEEEKKRQEEEQKKNWPKKKQKEKKKHVIN